MYLFCLTSPLFKLMFCLNFVLIIFDYFLSLVFHIKISFLISTIPLYFNNEIIFILKKIIYNYNLLKIIYYM